MKALRTLPSARQRGVALVVVLILLLIMTLLGLASLRGTLLEQRMSANLFDRSLAFQAAEAALREGEARVASIAPASVFPVSGCADGLCAPPDANDPDRWMVDAIWSSGASHASTANFGTLETAPRYIVEWLRCTGSAEICTADGRWRDRTVPCITEGDVSPDAVCSQYSHRYRVTARAAAGDRAAVILQSTLAAP